MPNRIQNAPDLWLGLELYWAAFHDLTTCRTGGMAVLPIPWTSMIDWACAYGLDQEQTEDLIYFMQEMDTVFRDHCEKKNKPKKPPTPTK